MRMGRQGDVDRKRRSCSGSRNGTPAAKGPAPAPSPGEVGLEAQLESALAAAGAAAAASSRSAALEAQLGGATCADAAAVGTEAPGSVKAPGRPGSLVGFGSAGSGPAVEPTDLQPCGVGQSVGARAPTATPASAAGETTQAVCTAWLTS